MSRSTILGRLSKFSFGFKRNSSPSPPPYEAIHQPSATLSPSPEPKSKMALFKRASTQRPILATDTPQWNWSTLQCREWLTAVFIQYLGANADIAAKRAELFYGYGPSLFSRDSDDWAEYLGQHIGMSLYLMILEKRDQEGAVPRGMNMGHGSPKK